VELDDSIIFEDEGAKLTILEQVTIKKSYTALVSQLNYNV